MTYSTENLFNATSERPLNHQGKPRRVGIEIELAGVEPHVIAECIQKVINGEVEWQSPFEITLTDTDLGVFKIELDSSDIKKIGEDSVISGDPSAAPAGFDKTYIELVSSVASSVVPWEIVTPPIQFADVPKIYELVKELRDVGAKGTKDGLLFAFGVHLNPEPTDLQADTIVRYMKSFFCLYEWIKLIEKPDLARRVTPYINHFDEAYILKVLATDYLPTTDELIQDYLDNNPTRNRNLDMLPMFAFLDAERVERTVQDGRINARPTFHYRLPNCEIGDPEWNIDRALETWMLVEELAFDDSLQSICDEYQAKLSGALPTLGKAWGERVAKIAGLPKPDTSASPF